MPGEKGGGELQVVSQRWWGKKGNRGVKDKGDLEQSEFLMPVERL